MYIAEFFSGQPVVESAEPEFNQILKKFLPFVKHHLELNNLPKIILLDKPLEGTFGRYGDGEVRVMVAGRHPIDALRTLAHELVHYKQELNNELDHRSGETGSPEENEANSLAGVIMRDFDQAFPELLQALKEDVNDSESLPAEELDQILVDLCQMIIDGQKQDSDYYGMVAACVVQPGGKRVYGLNYLAEDGKRVHAERAAIDACEDVGPDCMIVTTLSPCNEPMDERYGESCEDLIKHLGIKHVYCGYRDPTQQDSSCVETKNTKLRNLCKQFADTFLEENFADGKKPGRKGLAKRAGASCSGSVTDLRARAKNASGERAKMYHWCANMKSGKK